MISLNVNGKKYDVDVSDDVPLLWVLRDHLKLTGTKFSCGIGEYGKEIERCLGFQAFK